MTEGEQDIGIKFSPSVEYSSSICNIDDLVTKQEIGNLILTGEKDPVKVGILENDSTIETLASLNDLKYNDFKLLNYRVLSNQAIPYVGQKFNVTPMMQSVQIQVEKEVVKQEVIEYITETIEDPNLPVGETYITSVFSSLFVQWRDCEPCSAQGGALSSVHVDEKLCPVA